ncbi:MAG: hypothetical protein AAF170_14205 [Bacteroidota bacterium]
MTTEISIPRNRRPASSTVRFYRLDIGAWFTYGDSRVSDGRLSHYVKCWHNKALDVLDGRHGAFDPQAEVQPITHVLIDYRTVPPAEEAE